MDLYDRIIRIIDYNLIFCLIPMIVILYLIHITLKNRYQTLKALTVIKWVIIIYTIITVLHFIVGISFFPDKYAFTNRATGPYKLFYWLMFFSSSILPFTLFIKKLAHKFWYVLLVAFGIKIGVYFERYIIIITSIHRDYLPDRFPSPINIWTYSIAVITLQAFILIVILLAILKFIDRDSSLRSE